MYSALRRLERLESKAQPQAVSLLAWNDHGQRIPLRTSGSEKAAGLQRLIAYDRFQSQRAFDQLPQTFKGFSGPVGSGKSKALCHEVIKAAYLNPGVPGLLGAPTEKLLNSSTLIELLSILDQQGIPHVYRKSAGELHFLEPGSRVLLATLDHPERLRGTNLGWFGVDELTYCKEAAWLRLLARIRHPLARYRRGFAVWTPKGHDWVWRRFISARKLADHASIQAKPFENTAVMSAAPEYYKNMEHSYDERFYKQEVLGEYLDLYSGSVYHAFSEANVEECSFNPNLPLIVALDFNVNPMAGLILQCEQHYGRKTVHVIQEIVLPGSHTVEWCEQFFARIDPLAAEIAKSRGQCEVQLFGDATGGSTHSSSGGSSNWDIVKKMINDHTISGNQPYRYRDLVPNKNPFVMDRVNAVNGMLCSFAEKDAKERKLFINPSCSQLITDLEEVKWKVDANGATFNEIDKRDPKRTHASDALGYYIESQHARFNGKAVRDTF